MSFAQSVNPVSHCFNIDDAKVYGVHAAILLQNIKYWVWHNKLNKSFFHFHEKRYWTFNSMNTLQRDVFPYLTFKQIRVALNKLLKCKAIISGNFNKASYDRTLWYSIPHETAESEDFLNTDNQKWQMHLPSRANECQSGSTEKPLPSRANGFAKKGKPIPDINTDIKEKRKNQTVPPEPDLSAKQLLEYWNSKNIIRHTITDTLVASIAKAIRKRAIPLEAIKQAVDRYAEVLHREDCFWSYKWNLRDFLTSKTALRFYIEEFDIVTYISSSGPKKVGQGERAKLDDDSPITDKGALILDSILAHGREQYLKKGLDHEHLS